MCDNKNPCLCEIDKLHQAISYICKNQYEYFLNKSNVVGVGCGYKVKGGFYTKQLCIQVFVSRKISKYQLLSQDIIPTSLKGIPTDVVQTGIFRECSLREKVRPVKGGYNIGLNSVDVSGSAGCLVTNGVRKYILSTNHVLANINGAEIGHPIVQPSQRYGGMAPTDIVSTLSKYIPIRFSEGTTHPVNLSDCAVAELVNYSIMSPEIAFIGKLKCVKNPVLNLRVKKVGSTSDLTVGNITSVDVTFTLRFYNNKRGVFQDQVFTNAVAEKGDSGAVLVNDNNCAVGLFTARSDEVSVFSRMTTILDQLDIKIVT